MTSSTVNPVVFESYPDRGFQAYSVVLGAWLALFPASGLLNSTGIFQAWLLVNQLDKYTEPQIAWIFSTFAFLFFFGGIQAGPIFDRYGLRYLLPTGAFGLFVSLVCTSFCTGRRVLMRGDNYSSKLTSLARRILPVYACIWVSRRSIFFNYMDYQHRRPWTLVHAKSRIGDWPCNNCWWDWRSLISSCLLTPFTSNWVSLDNAMLCGCHFVVFPSESALTQDTAPGKSDLAACSRLERL
ncbi:hypothetical protein LB503_003420 [Fusarium chuoi]|nr:hypothetical protein LB503_003420 [Fusarium chuoi]